MRTAFKKGDRVRVKEGASNLYRTVFGPVEGVVEYANGGSLSHKISVQVDNVVGAKLFRAVDLELVTDENAKIEAALAQTKNDLGLCSEFDDAVDRARNMTFVDRLKHVAATLGRQDVFTHSEAILNKPEYAMPEVPAKGDYVRLTMADGSTEEGEVYTVIQSSSPEYAVHLRGRGSDRKWIAQTQEHADKFLNNRGFFQKKENLIVKVEKIDRPVEIPEIGRWIKATYQDGHTHQFEVVRHRALEGDTYLGKMHRAEGFIPGDPTKTSWPKERIVKWEYVDAPTREWKVGDVVPAGTVVGKAWLGGDPEYLPRRCYFQKWEKATHEWKIVWIEG